MLRPGAPRALVALSLALLAALATLSESVPSSAAATHAAAPGEGGCDALCSRVRSELANFTGWLSRTGAQG